MRFKLADGKINTKDEIWNDILGAVYKRGNTTVHKMNEHLKLVLEFETYIAH